MWPPKPFARQRAEKVLRKRRRKAKPKGRFKNALVEEAVRKVLGEKKDGKG